MTIWWAPVPVASEPPAEWPDLIVLAATVLGEAEGESYLGKRAVAHVIMNRVADKRWPDRPSDVCLQPKQFSCWNVGSPRLPSMFNPHGHVEEHVWNDCFRAAIGAWTHEEPDPSCGANCYLAAGSLRVLPIWAKADRIVTKIDNHTFYAL